EPDRASARPGGARAWLAARGITLSMPSAERRDVVPLALIRSGVMVVGLSSWRIHCGTSESEMSQYLLRMPVPPSQPGHSVADRAATSSQRLAPDASARCPGPELVGVENCPDGLDPVACDVERQHRHGDAVLLSHQTGLAVDRPLQDRHAAHRTGRVGEEARDLLAAFDRAQNGADQAA